MREGRDRAWRRTAKVPTHRPGARGGSPLAWYGANRWADRPDLRQLTDRLLGEAGYETVLLPDAKRFRAASAAAVADLLILDVMLPGRSGLDLGRVMRHRLAGGQLRDDGLNPHFEPFRVAARLACHTGET